MRDAAVLNAFQYQDRDKLYNGEVGKFDGIRWIIGTNPFLEQASAGQYCVQPAIAGTKIYTTLVLGANAIGAPKLGGTATPWKPSVTILDKPDKSDPSNQFVIAAWKNFWAAICLNRQYCASIRSFVTAT
jgi:N4-gp56 family major capsid protein